MKLLKIHSGFSLIEILIAIGAFSLVVMAITTLNLQLSQQMRQTSSSVQLEVLRRSFLALVTSNASWDKTINSSHNVMNKMGCLAKSKPCTVEGSPSGRPIQNQKFALYDAKGDLVYDPGDLSKGFSPDGVPCTRQVQPVSGGSKTAAIRSDECPYSYDITWSAQCAVGNCVDPQVKVSVKLKFNPKTAIPSVNLDRYSLPDIVRSAK